ncbi:ribokinase [Oenococcus kitaharae]|uniref:ribokinase n=1 Tax=Oenococcus TaxID=46254 RepID=UPI0004838C5F|nr:ribokinase [Oenococcus kitaharae]MCV3296288.1 ribokinase [Oenococcus kitaharae]OEY81373.1 ribokinase [Oenococcus kitaharae]OEY82861.1 ribokinase [Oenococcus kitaharae]OEY84595.1 ribokinase [Oenococcus kitaharae]
MEKQNKKIVVLGSLNVDTIQHMDKLPERGETIHINSLTSAPGGKGANQAVAAARQGAQVSFIGAVGDDANGRFMKQALADNQIDVSRIVTKSVPTGSASILLEADGSNTILVYGGANMRVTVEDVQAAEDEIAEADAIITQFETPIPAAIRAFEIAKKHHVMTILNPAPAKKIDAGLLRLSDFVTPNETEAQVLIDQDVAFNQDSLMNAAQALEKLGVKNTLITLGKSGSFYKVADKSGMIPSFKVKAVDTTAAGDTFIGVFAANIKNDLSNLVPTLIWASRSSSLTVQKAGALPSIPTFAEVEADEK